ncbi:calcium-binding protein [Leisingera sp. M658]|uniref:calcium-binding protein n=1 Tax=Leisingera sp. M658 TaxID=2867015 RepID=UPI0021A6DD2B|nr:calcium-binding protein [Leisingera sp. M658]UWQ73607.1 calcium-binding protein [Leisingera sp. M658]
MSTYTVKGDAKGADYETVSEAHFGVNLVTIYDEEYGDPASSLPSLVEELGVTNLRFPGGGATEYYFDMANPNADISSTDRVQDLLPMNQMFEQAGNSGLSVSIVIPTRTGFSQSAPKAMLEGSYGNRRELDPGYLSDLNSFLEDLIQESHENGVRISAIELGNEFWGSGEMTASEYGFLVAKLLPIIDEFFSQKGIVTPEIIVQGTSSASEVYSPREDTIVHIDPEKDMYGVFSEAYIDEHYDGIVPNGWITVNVDGQGSAYDQVVDITSQINSVPGSADLVGGVLHHYYVSKGLSSVDEANSFMFAQYKRFEDLLSRSDSLEQLSYHVTEWNSNHYGENARGLEHAAMMVEMFYEQLTHGIDVSQIWPLTFDTTQSITLTDLEQENLTIAGETYSLLRENLVGMTPVLDWSVEGEIDAHGFGDGYDFKFIVSNRSGEERTGTKLDFSEIVGDDSYFVKSTMLSDGAKGGADHRAEPVLTFGESTTSGDGVVKVDQEPWALTFIDFTRIGDGDDYIDGSANRDVIRGQSGDDTFFGNSASDRLYGEEGSDTISGGTGRDYLNGGQGNDHLYGNSGRDKIVGGGGADTVFGGTWHDTIFGSTGGDWLDGENGRDEIYGGRGRDTIFGGGWDDTVSGGKGADIVDGGLGRDLIAGGKGSDRLTGGDGEDTIYGGRGSDILHGGHGSDRIIDGTGLDIVTGGEGADHFIFTSDGQEDRLTDFKVGLDLLDLRLWSIEQISKLDFSEDRADGTYKTAISFNDERLVLDNVTEDELLSAIDGGTLLF